MATLGQSLASLASGVSALLATRLELFSLELLQARDRLMWRLAALLVAAVCLLLALLVASLAVALAFWDSTYRFLALGVLALFYALLAVGLFAWLVRRLRQDPDPFAATLDVLCADARALGAAGASAGEAVGTSPPGAP